MSDGLKDRIKRSLLDKEVIVNGVIKAEALDISVEGMYIYTRASFIPGVICEVNFKLNGETIKTMVKVQHVQHNVGIGVKFIDLPEAELIKIKNYLGQ